MNTSNGQHVNGHAMPHLKGRKEEEKGTGYFIDEGNQAQPPKRMIVPATSGIRNPRGV